MKTVIGAALLLASSTLFAATPVNNPTLEKYVMRSMANCPGGAVKLMTADGVMPEGFNAYKASFTSTDNRCGRNATVLASKTGDALFVGDVFQIPAGAESLDKRLGKMTGTMLKRTVTASISTTPTKDGLRPATLTAAMPQGAFEYHGWVDKSGKVFLVGKLGSKNVDPGETLLASLKAATGATRGNGMARIRIVEISDFQCPTCKLAHDMIDPILKRNMNKISYTRLDLPLFEHHDWALKAAIAARAIQKVAPEKYWEFVDQIFTNQEVLSKDSIDVMVRDFADDRNIDWKKFSAIYQSAAAKKEALAQVSRAYDNGIYSTPTYIVNGQVIFFGNEGDYLRSYIEGLLSGRPMR